MSTIVQRIARCGIVPVATVNCPDEAVSLARALVAGGVDVIEIALRSAAALDALERVVRECPDIVCLAGTVVEAAQVAEVCARGVHGVISPGFTEDVAGAIRRSGVAWFPGVATASDVMRVVADGWYDLKFFPAEQAGGVGLLDALSGPFPQVRFIPTGGIGPANLGRYLALRSVVAVGGSWLVPESALRTSTYAEITTLARNARSSVDSLRER
jgi:2-dehydro-3-deoxyphosphogluconate aldolase/(4S)-4-hydroxy-2-oxoglutarate aldolase